MRLLVLGGGGREHALIRCLARSPLVSALLAAPGNGGIADQAHCVNADPTDLEAMVDLARAEAVSLVVVGPEAPLAAGLVDAMEEHGIAAFGPSRRAARLETSKVYAKRVMRKYGIPTADFRVFDDAPSALAHLADATYPRVVKADGLAGGKGVYVCPDALSAREAVEAIMLGRRHGEAGRQVVVEECLMGEEASLMAVTDGEAVLTLPAARDYKRALDDDRGPNTGGMGAYSPAEALDARTEQEVVRTIVVPAIHAMSREGHPFKGVLYAGLMLTRAGPRALEFNVRFGDPETQAVLSRLRSDLAEILVATCEHRLGSVEPAWDTRPAVCVVMASQGYPGEVSTGHPVEGLAEAEAMADVAVYHAGTRRADGRILTSGGRVLGVTALGEDRDLARRRAYEACERIHFEGASYRRDVGLRTPGPLQGTRRGGIRGGPPRAPPKA
ncbi:MAG: phosphoribosylamine--glycine ligase [Planctomycetes bacterium]|nr:phosphoribosylamine--glycine ligase [Planctomycetota bacterium]